MAVGALAVCASTVRAGGPPVVLAVLDRVVLEPNETNPTRVQVWGTFALAKGQGKYEAPVSGCLYYEVVNGDEKECRKEWQQLSKQAGKKEVVAFGFCHSPEQAGKVRRDISKKDVPDTYPLGSVEVVTRAEDWQAIDEKAIKGLLKTTAKKESAPPGKGK
jgi:hypothetical protein